MLSSPPPPMPTLDRCCRCCLSPSAKLQRAVETRQKPICTAGGGAARLPITRRADASSLLLGLAGMAVAAPALARADDESNVRGGGEGGKSLLGSGGDYGGAGQAGGGGGAEGSAGGDEGAGCPNRGSSRGGRGWLGRRRRGGSCSSWRCGGRARAASLLLGLAGMAVAAPVRADDESSGGGEEGVLGAIKKVLPKAYLKAAREVVRTLRESLEEDGGGDMAKFRWNADAAKESIREFLGGWRGQQAAAAEKAIGSLAEFYSEAGSSAPLPQDVKNKILNDLSTADI
uniref:Photosystem II D1 processing protein PSB27-H2, chloroplastic n=1 Tax=Setaria italica TaxID=4555 RepID=K4AJZ9_SETIT